MIKRNGFGSPKPTIYLFSSKQVNKTLKRMVKSLYL